MYIPELLHVGSVPRGAHKLILKKMDVIVYPYVLDEVSEQVHRGQPLCVQY